MSITNCSCFEQWFSQDRNHYNFNKYTICTYSLSSNQIKNIESLILVYNFKPTNFMFYRDVRLIKENIVITIGKTYTLVINGKTIIATYNFNDITNIIDKQDND